MSKVDFFFFPPLLLLIIGKEVEYDPGDEDYGWFVSNEPADEWICDMLNEMKDRGLIAMTAPEIYGRTLAVVMTEEGEALLKGYPTPPTPDAHRMRRAGQVTAALMTSISKAEAGRRVLYICYSEDQRAAAEQIACRLLGDGIQVTDHLLTMAAGSVEFGLSGRRPQSDPHYVLYEQVPPDKSWHYVENSLPGSEAQWYTEGHFEGEE